MVKKKNIKINIISAYFYQITAIICSFILPKLILYYYGSEVNGLVSSITQFLSVIALTDMGVNVVVQTNLYKPLIDKDDKEVSKIMVSASKFFRSIGAILFFYVVLLCLFYPYIIQSNFNSSYIIFLIIILSINYFSQYLFGIVRTQLISADQKQYICNFTNSFTLILNTALCTLLMLKGYGIHVIKAITALCYLISPIVYVIYVKRNYNIDWKIKYEDEPIKQKWNGVAQHVNNYVNSNTDVIVLSFFSNVTLVSVYSIYRLVLNGIKQLLSALGASIQPFLGTFWAAEDMQGFKNMFAKYESIIHFLGILVFGCTSSLITSFVLLYTNGITDANYNVPLFSYLITFALFLEFYSTPYNVTINAIGKFKETQICYIVTALLNVIISVICVSQFGLVGVAIGTLVAATFQAIWLGKYFYKNLYTNNTLQFYKKFIGDILIFAAGTAIIRIINVNISNWGLWIIAGIVYFVLWLILLSVYDFASGRCAIKNLWSVIRKKIK